MTTDPDTLPLPLASALFTYQFTQLISAGISLVRELDILAESPPPYGEAAAFLRDRVGEGSTLSAAMAERPALFSPFYRSMIRAGEVGGILDETLARAAELMTKEWRLMERAPQGANGWFLLNPSEQPAPDDWADLSPYQQTVTLLLFCEAFGLMLQSGVPILQAMEHASTLLPATQRDKMMEARTDVQAGDRIGLERLGILPRFAVELIRHGEEMGTLDSALDRAARVFAHELDCRFPGAGGR